MSYHPDRIERRNRRKAILITTLLYGGLMTFFFVKDDITWSDYFPEVITEMLGEEPPVPAVADTTTEVVP